MNRRSHRDDHHDRGLQFDVQTLIQRRHALKLFAGAAAFALVGCSNDNSSTSSTPAATNTTASGASPTTTANSAASVAAAVATIAATATVVAAIPTTATPLSSCTIIPTETAGPFPGDGSNGPNALAQSGIVRSDIRASFGTSTTVARGVPLTVKLTIVDTKDGCKAMSGAAVYLWHCDMDGRYSMYTQGVTNENYLRGVQTADANGVVTFQSIFPAAYSGRWPHIHFEVYPSLGVANSSANKRATSQLALPDDICKTVFATAGYEKSITNHAQTPLTRDNIFSDGVTLQMATVTGSVAAGYVATLVVGA